MPDYDPDELVMVEEIAQRCDTRAMTVYGWRWRGHLPEPAKRYGRSMLWRWADVECVPIVRRALGRPQASDQ